MRPEIEVAELSQEMGKQLNFLYSAAIGANWELAWKQFIECDSILSELRELVRKQVFTLREQEHDDGK